MYNVLKTGISMSEMINREDSHLWEPQNLCDVFTWLDRLGIVQRLASLVFQWHNPEFQINLDDSHLWETPNIVWCVTWLVWLGVVQRLASLVLQWRLLLGQLLDHLLQLHALVVLELQNLLPALAVRLREVFVLGTGLKSEGISNSRQTGHQQ